MQLYIQFPDFSNTMAIDRYIEDRLKTIQHRLDARYKDSKITLRGIVSGRKPTGEPKNFVAEIIVKIPRSKAPFVVKKKGPDFRTVLSDAADAMENILQKDSEKAERSRKMVGKTLRPVRQVKSTGVLNKKRKKA